jgi:hypothetical protein
MYVNAYTAAADIASIAATSAIDSSLVPALISQLNQYPHSTRVALAALASALGTVSQA